VTPGQGAGGGVVPVGPDEQFAGGVGDEPLEQCRAVTSAPGIRSDDELGLARADDRRRDIGQHECRARPGAQLDEGLIGEGGLAIEVGGARSDLEQPLDVRT
jgi:hypothetical protein